MCHDLALLCVGDLCRKIGTAADALTHPEAANPSYGIKQNRMDNDSTNRRGPISVGEKGEINQGVFGTELKRSLRLFEFTEFRLIDWDGRRYGNQFDHRHVPTGGNRRNYRIFPHTLEISVGLIARTNEGECPTSE
jgi:hypothetical protein